MPWILKDAKEDIEEGVETVEEVTQKVKETGAVFRPLIWLLIVVLLTNLLKGKTQKIYI